MTLEMEAANFCLPAEAHFPTVHQRSPDVPARVSVKSFEFMLTRNEDVL